MTNTQKQRIEYLRGKGESYAAIADTIGVSENTVKSYCRRNNIGIGVKAEQAATEDACANCGHPLEHTPGSKRKRFCSDRCRMAWWKAHPEAVNRKAVYRFVCPACGVGFESYGNAAANTAPGLVSERRGRLPMSKDEVILRYKSAMAVFKNWLSEGVISGDDLLAIDTMLAQKYGLSSCSIFLENDLLCKEKRVIYGSAKGGRYGQKDNEN